MKIFDVYVQVMKLIFCNEIFVFFVGIGEKIRGLKLSYEGCLFHRIVKNFMIQSGDFTEGNK